MEFPNFEQMYKAYQEVRLSGKYNMLEDSNVVKDMLEIGGLDAVMPLLEETSSGNYKVDRKAYAAFLREVSKTMSIADILERS